MRCNYGIPYMGSKNKIAEWVVGHLPKATHFYDLFVGGGAVTHCAMLQNKYKQYIINDINALNPKFFLQVLRGELKHENRWISREDFFKKRKTDGYVRNCFSFGNNGQDYIYGRPLEPYKKAFHQALFFNDYAGLCALGVEIPPPTK